MGINDKKIKHRITHSEIVYARLYAKKSDGTMDFFSSLPEHFTMSIRGKIAYNKRFRADKIYLGVDIVTIFHEGDIVTIYKNDDKVIIE